MSSSDFRPGPVVWRPGPGDLERSRLTEFMRQHGIASFDALMDRSTADVAWFTDAVLRFLDIRFRKPYTQVLDTGEGIAFARWCVGGELNIVESCVDRWLEEPGTAARLAIVWEGEEGIVRRLTYTELGAEVNRCANALRALGLGRGDAVGIHMPMTPEIAVALLAVVKIGGVVVPLFSGYGAGAIAGRLADAEAKCLFTCDGAPRRGSVVPLKETADRALTEAPSVRHAIVLRRTGHPVTMRAPRDLWWHELVPQQSSEAVAAPTSAEDLLMIIYTSGTTGRPKGAVHTHCGFPVKAAQDMAFGTDVHAGEVIHWITDMGWMMGPWLVFGATLLGATCLLSDGSPDFPQPDRIWQMVARHRIGVLGLSPTFVRALAARDALPGAASELETLRAFASTGEAWNPDPWHWLFDRVGEKRRPIINYSGGTEISGGIVMGNPILPLKATAFSGPCPGIAADVVDESGQSIRGQVGELVIRAPWIGMTRGFWKDPDRYLETYWSRWKDTWVHGDWAAVDDDGLWYILGRSDDTIKVAGKRVGPAEIESALVAHPAVSEAAAIGVPDEMKGSAVVCFAVLAGDQAADAALAAELRERVATDLGKALVPARIEFVSDLPKTRNAKIMRRLIRASYLGLPPGDTSSIANPGALDEIAALAPPPK